MAYPDIPDIEGRDIAPVNQEETEAEDVTEDVLRLAERAARYLPENLNDMTLEERRVWVEQANGFFIKVTLAAEAWFFTENEEEGFRALGVLANALHEYLVWRDGEDYATNRGFGSIA